MYYDNEIETNYKICLSCTNNQILKDQTGLLSISFPYSPWSGDILDLEK